MPFEDGLRVENERTFGEAFFCRKASLGESRPLGIIEEDAFVADDFAECVNLRFEERDFSAFFCFEQGAYTCDELVNRCDFGFHGGAEDMRWNIVVEAQKSRIFIDTGCK